MRGEVDGQREVGESLCDTTASTVSAIQRLDLVDGFKVSIVHGRLGIGLVAHLRVGLVVIPPPHAGEIVKREGSW